MWGLEAVEPASAGFALHFCSVAVLEISTSNFGRARQASRQARAGEWPSTTRASPDFVHHGRQLHVLDVDCRGQNMQTVAVSLQKLSLDVVPHRLRLFSDIGNAVPCHLATEIDRLAVSDDFAYAAGPDRVMVIASPCC